MKNRIHRTLSFLMAVCLTLSILPAGEVHAAANLFQPGQYYIVSALDENKVLDIHCMSTENGANAQIYQLNNCGAQIFSVSWKSGWAVIVNSHSNKALDVQSGATHAGANVWQYEQNGTDAQKWDIIPTGDGYYYIKAKCGKYLDVWNGSSANNTNVQIWDFNGSDAQKWRFVPMSQLVNDDSYYIYSAVGDNKVLDIRNGFEWNKANVQLYKLNNSHAQRFKVKRLQNGYYTIQNEGSKKYLDIANGSYQAGANVWQYQYNGSYAQQWYFMPCGGDWFYIVGKNGLYLDVSNGSNKNGANIQVWTGNQTKAQKFKLVPVVSYRYTTLTYNCSSLDKWLQSARITDPVGISSKPGVVIGQKVLEYRSLQVYNPQTRRNFTLRVPYRVQFKIHYHDYVQGFGRSWYLSNNSIITRQSCDCGYSRTGAIWEIPDLTEMSGSQTTATVISNLPQIN